MRGCLNKYFHKFEFKWVYDIKITNIGKIEIINLTISDKSMSLLD